MGLCIKKKDYEKYSLILPYRFLFGERRKSFLNSELEKLHPCFSDEFCFDSDFQRPTSRGMSTEVLVMHKYKLAEYEGKNLIVGSGFLAEGGSHHKYFVAERFKLLSLAVLCFVIFMSLSLIAMVRGKKKSEVETVFPESLPVIESEGYEEEDGELILGSLLFETVKAGGGKLSFLQWQTDGFHESLEVTVKGLYPEDFNCFDTAGLEKAVSFNTVYEKEVPVIEFSAVRKIRNKAGIRQNNNLAEDKAFYGEARKVLRSHCALIEEEMLSPYKVKFICNGTPEIFKELADLIEQYEKSVCRLLLTVSDGKLQVEISAERAGFQSAASAGINLSLFSENLDLIIKKQEKKNQSKPAVKNVTLEKGMTKIGQIKGEDGHIISFYKTSEGKIKRIREE